MRTLRKTNQNGTMNIDRDRGSDENYFWSSVIYFYQTSHIHEETSIKKDQRRYVFCVAQLPF